MTAADRWREALASWAIPDEILAAAPTSPHGFPVEIFEARAQRTEDTPSRRRALEALSGHGSVLDVGCGAGAAALALTPPASEIVGVDESAGMLEAFARLARERDVQHTELEGRWPDIADRAPIADVVVCHHVVYNVGDLDTFARALDDHGRRRVIVELTREHPMAWTNPLWLELHDLRRPQGPTVDDAVAVLGELGIAPGREDWEAPFMFGSHHDHAVEFVRRRLCLPEERDDEIRRALDRHPPPATRSVTTLWWD